MRKLFFVLLATSFILFSGCDDGDIITVELDFENTFEVCDGGSDLVFYKTKNDPSESLSLKISNLNIDAILDVDTLGVFENEYTISTSNPFNYRTYSNNSLPTDLFCNVIPSSGVNITQDIESTSGTAQLRTVLIEDDNDGIPAELENQDPNGDGLFDDAQDTDGDGLPDYIDADDDGDNILTKDENPDPNGDADLSDAQNTDSDSGDTTPDYLDADDDGDGINTRDEENDSQDQNPANDITFADFGPDYLNKDATILGTPAAIAFREHTISQTYTVTLVVSDIDLELIALDVLDFGTLSNTSTTNSRRVTPEFP